MDTRKAYGLVRVQSPGEPFHGTKGFVVAKKGAHVEIKCISAGHVIVAHNCYVVVDATGEWIGAQS